MAKRVDANQKEVVKTLRDLGISVIILSDVGKGCPDIACGYGKRNYFVEIKDGSQSPSRQKLTEHEQKFHDNWQGHVCIIRSKEEAINLAGWIKENGQQML